jgi:hypothetical protein
MIIFEIPEDELQDYGKVCSRCKEWRFWEQFHHSTPDYYKDGLRTVCKSCRVAYDASHYEKNAEREKTRARDKRAADPDAAIKARAKKFGLTLDQLLKMYSDQDHRCAWCGRHESELNYLCVDHDRNCCPGERSCGQCVRQLLCERCNFAEGHLKHWPEALVVLNNLAWYNPDRNVPNFKGGLEND